MFQPLKLRRAKRYVSAFTVAICATLITACGTTSTESGYDRSTTSSSQAAARYRSPVVDTGEVRTFRVTSPDRPRRSNAEMAKDFVNLSFQLETGQPLRNFHRFDGAIRIAIAGQADANLRRELTALVNRLRAEARLPINVSNSQDAEIVIHPVSSPLGFGASAGTGGSVVPIDAQGREASWGDISRRERVRIYLVTSGSSQDVRNSLHEEVAQALGPLNDLYSLPDSVFNDDNVHGVLTGFDMLMLRAYYDPALQTGMSRPQVAARIRGVLDRLNPAGRAGVHFAGHVASPDFNMALRRAFNPVGSRKSRAAHAMRAVTIAKSLNMGDLSVGYADFVYGRLIVGSDPASARAAFSRALQAFSTSRLTSLHETYVRVHLAALSLDEGRSQAALSLLSQTDNIARQYQNAQLLAAIYDLKARAYALSGNAAASNSAKVDSHAWGRYGFSSDAQMQRQLSQIYGG